MSSGARTTHVRAHVIRAAVSRFAAIQHSAVHAGTPNAMTGHRVALVSHGRSVMKRIASLAGVLLLAIAGLV